MQDKRKENVCFPERGMSAGHHSATGAGLQLLHPASALGRAPHLQSFFPAETFEVSMTVATLGLLSLVQAFPQL